MDACILLGIDQDGVESRFKLPSNVALDFTYIQIPDFKETNPDICELLSCIKRNDSGTYVEQANTLNVFLR